MIQTARRVTVDPTQSKTSLADHSIWEGVVRQFVKTHQNVGTLPWLHMPEATDLVTGVTTEADLATVSAAASPAARLQAALKLIMEKLLAQAQRALELGVLTQHPDVRPQAGQSHATRPLSDEDTALCCVMLVQKMAALFKCKPGNSSSLPIFQSILASTQTVFIDSTMTKASASQPSVNSELLIAATQQTTQQLRDSIACWPDLGASCMQLLVQLHRLTRSKLVIDQLVKQGGK